METPALQRALASGYLTLPSIMENSSGLTPQEQQLYAASLQRQQTTGMAAIETIKNIAVGVNEGEDRFQLILLGQSPAIGTSSVLPHTSAHNSPQISPKKLMATASTPKESTRKRGSGTPLARTPKSTVKRCKLLTATPKSTRKHRRPRRSTTVTSPLLEGMFVDLLKSCFEHRPGNRSSRRAGRARV
jgi:hypothetical protein